MLQQYKNAIEQTNIISKTDKEGIITFVNEEFCKISGYTKEELVGKNHNIVRHPDVDPEVFRRLWATITQKKIYKATVKNRNKSGETFYVNTTIIPITDTQGEIVEYVAIRYDVTQEMLYKESLEQKERELKELNATLEQKVAQKTKALMELNATLKQRVDEEIAKNKQKERVMFWQSRLASLGEMLSNIAHQWRQPLSELTIMLFSMKESFSCGDSKEFTTAYNRAKSLIASMSNTIEDFSTFFLPNRKKEPFCIALAIEEALLMLEGRLENEMISVNKELENLYALGVANELTQVMLNLLKNSVDAFASHAVLLREITIRLKQEGDYAVIIYSDNAGGIKIRDIYKVFEPYYTTKHKSRGTGLGLFIVKMICEQGFDGSIELQSVKQTTTFTIKIPLYEKI